MIFFLKYIHCLADFFFLRFLTPLHVASEKAHNDVVEVVVKHEAKVYFLCGKSLVIKWVIFCLADETPGSLNSLLSHKY